VKQLGQAMCPDELQALALGMRTDKPSTFDVWFAAAMDRHCELIALPGMCEVIARRDWEGVNLIAALWDY
jgi:hypothetical protein